MLRSLRLLIGIKIKDIQYPRVKVHVMPSILRCLGCVNDRTFFMDSLKIWPNLGYKRKKRFCFFRSFIVTCKISFVPGTGML